MNIRFFFEVAEDLKRACALVLDYSKNKFQQKEGGCSVD